ncbi:MAG: DUF4244 domain-containing protein [Actinomycetaceae bacterium]|nr:DUF4244 domain-containing protein [Arcanobacterium sp.]MDD7505642.1 DUF4244 domain-containing protein [Actinomycetaceae bacterium]MDY6143426.1 DUF4244 domain-containing protein [Arcanobacterium sp.]
MFKKVLSANYSGLTIAHDKDFDNKTHREEAVESGMVTAEYALGTVATTGIAGILVWLSQQEWLRELIADIFKSMLG